MSNPPWRIHEEIEKPFRDALDCAAKRKIPELHEMLSQMTDMQMASTIGLSNWVAAYTAIDVVERRWPTDAALRRMAQKVTQGANRDEQYGVTEENVYKYVSQVALQQEPYDEVFEGVFEDPYDFLCAPIFFTVNMLAAFTPKDKSIWEFLEQIETAFEAAFLVDLNVLPALMIRARMPVPDVQSSSVPGRGDGGA